MSDLNEVKLIGCLGKDPDVLKTSAKGCFVRLSLATNKKYANAKQEIREESHWHTIFLSNGLGKSAAAHLKKGSRVFIAGELKASEWQDEKTGEKRHSVAVYAHQFELITRPAKEPTV